MNRFGLIYLSTCLALVFAGFPGIAEAFAPERARQIEKCDDYDPNPRCTAKERNRLHESFGLPPIERMRSRARKNPKSELIVGIASVKRGVGLALVFRRDRDGDPSVEISRQRLEFEPSGYRPLRAKIPKEVWQELLAKADELRDVYARDDALVCGASFTIEIVNQRGDLRAPVGDSCGEEPRGKYFEALAEAAIAQFPYCKTLVSNGGEGPWERLQPCFLLQGDKKVAAELYNSLEKAEFWNTGRELDEREASEIRPYLSDVTELSWPGLSRPGIHGIDHPDAVADFFAGAWMSPFIFDYRTINAESQDRVAVEGCISIMYRGHPIPVVDTLEGTFTAIWIRGDDGMLRMSSFDAPARELRPAIPKTRKDGSKTIKCRKN